MNPNKFDAFTKALATPTSRRQAFRRIGSILAGVGLAGLLPPGLALANNSPCAHFCSTIFPSGPDHDKCVSDAAHHKGLCYTCGPASPGGSKPICCPQNAHGQCTCYSKATCCSNGTTCQNGTCVTPTTTTTSAPTTTTTSAPTTTTTSAPTTTTSVPQTTAVAYETNHSGTTRWR